MKTLVVTLTLLTVSTACRAAAGVTGTIDATPYKSLTHDLAANSLALSQTKSGGSGSTVTVCTFTIYDPKGEKKVDAIAFPEGIGSDNIAVSYVDKTWAIVMVQTTASDVYFSVKISSKEVKILGSREDVDFRFRFASGKNVVSYIPSTKTVQLFDAKLQPLGSPATVLGSPSVLNLGKYFRCTDGSRTQIWKVDSKGFTKLIGEAGDYKEINEAKRLCCIEDDDPHKLCKY